MRSRPYRFSSLRLLLYCTLRSHLRVAQSLVSQLIIASLSHKRSVLKVAHSRGAPLRCQAHTCAFLPRLCPVVKGDLIQRLATPVLSALFSLSYVVFLSSPLLFFSDLLGYTLLLVVSTLFMLFAGHSISLFVRQTCSLHSSLVQSSRALPVFPTALGFGNCLDVA